MKIAAKDVQKLVAPYKPKAILVLVDELGEVVNDNNFKLVNSIQHDLGSIARLGRAAACHLVLATQRPSSNVINAELKGNIKTGVLLGDFDASASALIFDEDVSNLCRPEIKGRGFIKSGKEIIEFQSYWTKKEKHFVKKDLSQLPKLDQNQHRQLDISDEMHVQDVVSALNVDHMPVKKLEVKQMPEIYSKGQMEVAAKPDVPKTLEQKDRKDVLEKMDAMRRRAGVEMPIPDPSKLMNDPRPGAKKVAEKPEDVHVVAASAGPALDDLDKPEIKQVQSKGQLNLGRKMRINRQLEKKVDEQEVAIGKPKVGQMADADQQQGGKDGGDQPFHIVM